MMDKIIIFIGVIATVLMSGVQPLNNLFFGDLTQNIVEYVQAMNSTSDHTKVLDKFLDDITLFAIQMAGIGLAMLILGYISMESFSYTASKQVSGNFEEIAEIEITHLLRFNKINLI